MKITRLVHSCLLVEEEGKTIIIDPGNYSFAEKALNISTINSLDYILITHEHQDHMDIRFLKELLQKFPTAKIISNEGVERILKQQGMDVSTTGDEIVIFEQAPHEQVFGVEVPLNVKFEILGKLSHPGDSFHFKLNTPVLAMPITAPWGSMTEAVAVIAALQPKVVIPIHDWHYKDDVRLQFYQRLTDYLKQYGIDFRGIDNGQSTEV